MANRWVKMETVGDFTFLCSKITANGDYSHGIKRCLLLGRKAMTKLDNMLKSRVKNQRYYFANKGLSSQSYSFSSSHVRMWELDHKEGWVPKNWWFLTVMMGKILQSPLDSKEIKPVSPKENQPWMFTGRTDAEAEAPILLHLIWKTNSLEKNPDAGKDWRREKGTTEDEIVGCHCQLNEHEQWDCWVIWQFYVHIFKEYPHCSP